MRLVENQTNLEKSKTMKKTLIIFFIILFGNSIQAKVTVATIFSDNMVLQRNTTIPIWGWADVNEKVTVKFHNQSKSVKADKSGKWMVRLDNEMAGGPYVLTIEGKNAIQIKNILVGEVWLCSGQSNMEWNVEQSNNAAVEIANANFPNIRHIKIPKEINSIPNDDFKNSKWEICSPETVANFTGIGYFYAKILNQELNIPIGIINASWGGTNIETWISREGFESSDEFKAMNAQMPKGDYNSLLDLKKKATKSKIETFQKYEFTTNKIPFYKDLNFDDNLWLEVKQPGFWDGQLLASFDGFIWLRKHFTLTNEEINQVISIEIPAIDDDDITYINGVKIGETKGWDIKRVYSIPTEILKEGDNVVSIRVADNGGSGGIYGSDNALKVVLKTKEIPLSGQWKFQIEAMKNSINENEFPSLCYNAMINPLLPFAFKGVLWYQGETNMSRAFQYKKAFPLLINDWRKKWNADFPFYFVQLATFKTNGNSNEGCEWAELREAQTETLQVSNTAMVVTTDIGDPNSIHPVNKQEVGKRFASIAMNNLYGKKMICSGPTFKSFENKEIGTVLTFENCGSGLSSSNISNLVIGFEVAGNDQVFYPAKGEIISENKIILSCDYVANPIVIRYAWVGDASQCNLFNKEGFPAVPFRTDDWKTITKSEKYKIETFK